MYMFIEIARLKTGTGFSVAMFFEKRIKSASVSRGLQKQVDFIPLD